MVKSASSGRLYEIDREALLQKATRQVHEYPRYAAWDQAGVEQRDSEFAACGTQSYSSGSICRRKSGCKD